MNEKLEAIATKASADLAVLIKEGEEKILEAWDAAVAEAQDNETKPKFKLAFAIDLDLDADVMSTKLSWGIKHTLTVNATIPDPNQTSLPLEQSAFDYAFHKESLLEIMRITSGEARLYPLVNFKAERSRIFAELKNDPDFADFIFEEVQTDFEFLKNSNAFVRIRRKPGS